MFYLLKGQKMDDMTRILPSNCSKVFIQRDFSDGTAVKFQTKFPAELDGKVKFKYIVLNFSFKSPPVMSYRLSCVPIYNTTNLLLVSYLKKHLKD